MVVGRGSLCIASLTDLAANPLPSGQPLELILAVPSRRYGEFCEMLRLLHDAAVGNADGGETITQVRKEGHRLTLVRDPARAQMMDSKLVAVKKMVGLKPVEIVQRYESLTDIERGFKVLKSEIDVAPIFHWLPERIRAHASICFMALILRGVMRQRLRAAGHGASPETVLAQLRRIQRQSAPINREVYCQWLCLQTRPGRHVGLTERQKP